MSDKKDTQIYFLAVVVTTAMACIVFFIFAPIWMRNQRVCGAAPSSIKIDLNWTIRSPPTSVSVYTKLPKLNPPHIIFFLTDDQDVGLEHSMPRTRRWMATSFTNAFSANPHCCPSRAALLVGRYYHNVRQRPLSNYRSCNYPNSKCGCMRANTDQSFEQNIYTKYLREAGYRTVYVGKYLNPPYMSSYCDRDSENRIPPHWDEFYGSCTFKYYGMSYTHNGTIIKNVKRYTTDYFSELAVDRISNHFRERPEQKLHLVLGYRAPHKPYTPNKNNNSTGLDIRPIFTAPGDRCFAKKHAPITRDFSPLTKREISEVKKVYRDRQLCMESVDLSVDTIIKLLEKIGVLNDTLLVFSSDHGYHLDLFNLGIGKTNAYTTDAQVPLFMRTPAGWSQPPAVINKMVGLVDLAATFIQAANVVETGMDGRSLLPLLLDSAPTVRWRRAQLVEHENSGTYPVFWYFVCHYLKNSFVHMLYQRFSKRIVDHPQNTYRAMYTDTGLTYIERVHRLDSFDLGNVHIYELYNNAVDPHQLSNVYHKLEEQQKTLLHQQLTLLSLCVGRECP